MASDAGLFRRSKVKMAKKKQAPGDGLHQFEQLTCEADHPVRSIWLDKGPPDTPVRLHALYGLKIGGVIVRCAVLEGRVSQ
jgi:hypothetical protein